MLALRDYDVKDILYEDAAICTYRACNLVRDVDVLLKTINAATPDARQLARLRREHALLLELDCDGVPRTSALVEYEQSLMLELEDSGGVPLSQLIALGPCETETVFTVALALADCIGCVHARRVILGDIRTQRVLFNPGDGSIQLIDFARASRLSREHPKFAGADSIDGALAYLSPEQTGLMNRTVDYRSDYYMLGVVLYELLTGQLPFVADDALEWVHCHVARDPRQILPVPGVPPMLASLVMKLLSKLAEDRYQSANGLRADLLRCRAQWRSGDAAMFALGSVDVSENLHLPQKLYGREQETAALHECFERIVASGQTEIMLVAGHPGIGKSMLVAELYKPIVARNAYFVSGKFDQYGRDIPYAAVIEAFGGFVQQMLAESEERIAYWRARILLAAAGNGQLLVDMIPRLGLIIGPQAPLTELPPDQARNRARAVVGRFVQAIASADHPLVLFFDDLQWADTASLALVEQLVCGNVGHLMLICAYRDNEVGASHPFSLMLSDFGWRQRPISTIMLTPLTHGDVCAVLADTLHCDREQAAPLACLIHAKTRGNPFFCFQFVLALHQDELLVFDSDAQTWRWNLARIEQRSFTENVVELMVDTLLRLPEATQDALRLAGFLGSQFELSTLAMVRRQRIEDTEADLWPALQVGLLIRDDGSCRFLHDRVQEAAFELTPEHERESVHLRIGRLLRASLSETALQERLFEVVNHLDRGAAQITDAKELADLAELNRRAGNKARKATMYAAAGAYFGAGVALLPVDSWSRDYALSFELFLAQGECEYLAGRLALADELLDVALANARDAIDRASVNLIRIRVLMTPGNQRGAREVALESLAEFGIVFPQSPTADDIEQAYADFDALLGGRTIESLVDLPRAEGPAMRKAIELMVSITTATYFSSPAVWALHVPAMAVLNLKYGNTPASTMVYAFFGFELAAGRQRYDEGYRFCEMACALMERTGQEGFRGNMLSHAAFTAVWVRPLDEVLSRLRVAIPACLDNGDLIMAATASHQVVVESWVRGEPLREVHEKALQCLALTAQTRYEVMEVCIRPRAQLAQQLRGLTFDRLSLSDAGFDEAAFEQFLSTYPLAMGTCYYHLTKLMGSFIFGEHDAASAAALRAKPLMWAVTGTLNHYLYVFFDALTLAARYAAQTDEVKTHSLSTLREHLQQLQRWTASCAETFEASHLLVAAEIARITEDVAQALPLYERAVQSARLHGSPQHEALANECAAQFYRQRGVPGVADHHLFAARDAYARWGADAKVRQLEQDHPILRVVAPSTTTPLAQLDSIAASKAAQAISGEIVRESLLQTLMEIVLLHAGAQFAALLLVHEDDLRLAATARVSRQDIAVRLYDGTHPTDIELPKTLLTYVRRTRERVLIADSGLQRSAATDPYLAARRPASALCLPIIRQGELMGAVYLEHQNVAGVFTSARLHVLEQLIAQAAISLENAQLYRQLQEQGCRYRALYDQNPSMYFTLNAEGIVLSVNSFGAQQMGYRAEELVGCHFVDFYSDDDRATGEQFLRKATTDPGELHRAELRKVTHDGRLVWMRETARLTTAADGGRLLLIVAEDTTESWKLSEELHYQATHDDLTGLPNRRDFERRLSTTLERIRDSEDRHSLCYFDLDQFKVVNDTCGHIAGDELLRQLSLRLKNTFRRQDIIARLGGDEFAVLMEHVSDAEARDMATRLLADIRDFRFVWDGRHFPIGASVGLVTIDHRSDGQQAILSAADAACYIAKERGGNRLHVFDETDHASAQHFGRLLWVPRITEALAEDRFFLVFQTIAPLQSDLPEGEHIELLLRLRERDGTIVLPVEFLPVAERYHLSSAIDQWVVGHALAWMAADPARLQRIAMCCINLSGGSIGDGDFQRGLDELLARTQVPMERLCFEITETTAITNMEQALRFIESLRARGCRFALDDFGSGLASFFYLKMLPVDYVKIDGVFVKDMLSEPFDVALVRSIHEVAHAGGMLTVAEFAENDTIIERLREIGVDYAQGYGIARPRPLNNF